MDREFPKGMEADRERDVWPYMEKVSRNPDKQMANLLSTLRQERGI